MTDAINPNHYKGFSNGAEVIDITENLVTNCGSAVKYLARAGRFDGQVKGEVLEDLKKAAWHVNREIERLEKSDEVVATSGHRFPRVFYLGADEPIEPGLVLKGTAIKGTERTRDAGDEVTLRREKRSDEAIPRWWCIETDTWRNWGSWLEQVDCLVEQ